jgi:hypothetical protein
MKYNLKIYLLFKLLFITLFLQVSILNAQELILPKLQTSDLVFIDLNCGELCDAIETVTTPEGKIKYSHVAMVIVKNDSTYVIEAYNEGVKMVAANVFFERNKSLNFSISRISSEYEFLIDKINAEYKKYLGKPYDILFDIENDKYYCSELIYFILKDANNNKELFDLKPMTFKYNETTVAAWQKYFNENKSTVPEGKLGCNPVAISQLPFYKSIFLHFK